MSTFLQLITYILPAIVVLIAMYLVMVEQNKRKEARDLAEIRSRTLATILPIRLQAYERIVLFLERISPENLVIRADGKGKSAKVFHLQLQMEIRAEYEHNMSQQLYMSQEAWVEVFKAKESILALINKSATEVSPEAAGTELGKRILENLMKMEVSPCHNAIREVKYDIQKLYRI